MRKMMLTVPTFAALLAAAPAAAQTYGDPSFPVCLQAYGRFSHIDCSYVSIQQCRGTAAGLPAQCIANPYYAGQAEAPSRRHRRHAY